MSNVGPFTLDFFNNTALCRALGLGVTASGTDDTDTGRTPRRPTLRHHRSARSPRVTPAAGARPSSAARTSLSRARARPRQGLEAARLDNLDAIRLAADIVAEDRPATANEQARLIRFTGFGASEHRLAAYRSRDGGTFAFCDELAAKRRSWRKSRRRWHRISTGRDRERQGRRERIRRRGRTARRASVPPTLPLNRPRRDPRPSSCAGLKKPAWPAGQGCSGAVAPVRPLRAGSGCLREEDEKGPAWCRVRNPKGASPWN
jgi:hypothetical protein